MNQPSQSHWRYESKDTVRLATPLIIAFAGNQLLGVVDTLIAGQMGTLALAAVGVGNVIFFGATVFSMGLISALETIASQSIGAGRPEKAYRGYRATALFCLISLLPVYVLLLWLGTEVLVLAGVDSEIQEEAQNYLITRSLSVFPLFLHVAARTFLQSHRDTDAIVWSTVIGNVLNVPLSLLLGFGDPLLESQGLGAIGLGNGLGVAGLGLATTFVAIVRFGVLWQRIRTIARPYAHERSDRGDLRELLRLGWPLGFHWLLEVGVFVTVTIFVASFGKFTAAGHQIVLQLSTFTFCACLGISGATCVRVGQAVGRRDHDAAVRAGWAGTWVSVVWMSMMAICFLTLPEFIVRLFTDDKEVFEIAVPLCHIVAVYQISDGIQATMAGALRGVGDTASPMMAGLFGHWCVGFPLGYYLSFYQDMGATGFWWGLTAGLTAASICLTFRFWSLSRGRFKALTDDSS